MLTETILKARRELRQLQNEFGSRITPAISIKIGNSWNRALEQDPEGSQLKYVLEESHELLSK